MIFDMKGPCVASAYREYPLHHLRAGWVEQSVPEIMESTASACLEAVGKIDAIYADAYRSLAATTFGKIARQQTG